MFLKHYFKNYPLGAGDDQWQSAWPVYPRPWVQSLARRNKHKHALAFQKERLVFDIVVACTWLLAWVLSTQTVVFFSPSTWHSLTRNCSLAIAYLTSLYWHISWRISVYDLINLSHVFCSKTWWDVAFQCPRFCTFRKSDYSEWIHMSSVEKELLVQVATLELSCSNRFWHLQSN